jgi:hypothetical protein
VKLTIAALERWETASERGAGGDATWNGRVETRVAEFSGIAVNATPLRDSRATLHGGSERFQAAGEAGSRPASLLLDPASLPGIRVVSGGGGIRTLEGPNGP